MNQRMGKFAKPFVLIVSVLLCWFGFNSCHALEVDTNQTIHLSADSADIRQAEHHGFYLGHVEFDQGTTHLRAYEAMTKMDSNNKLVEAVAKGHGQQQAHYWEDPRSEEPAIHAYADTIIYYPKKHFIELIGNARIKQGINIFKAPQISIDTQKQQVITQSNGTQRTTILFHPENKS